MVSNSEYSSRRGGGPAQRNQGFALIVTLSLMILLTVIAVGLLSLSSISLRSASNTSASQQARSNSRLALTLALGALQSELGPDQRISAPGGQQLALGEKSGSGQWAGAYDSWQSPSNPASDPRPSSPTFRRWLISGAENVVTDPAAPKNAAPWTDKISLVAADADTKAVEAGLIKIPNGAYAWWVGDQSAKAKLGGAVKVTTDAKVLAARMQTAPRAAHEPFLGAATTSTDPVLDRLISSKSLNLVANPVNPVFHSATTDSLGLLTNVRSGGFRKDLNFLMEVPLASAPSTALYSAGTKSGINLGELWVDHNVWAEVGYPASPLSHADGGKIPAGTPCMASLNDPISARNDPFLPYRHMAKLQVTLLFSLKSEKVVTAGVTSYNLYLVVDPIFTVWNPFNVCMRVPTSSFLTFKQWAIPYNFNLTLKGGPGGDLAPSTIKISDVIGVGKFFYAELGRNQEIVMRPGEVQVYSQGFNKPIQVGSKGSGYYESVMGWDFGSGYKYLINPTLYKVPVAANRNGSHRISYSMDPNEDQSVSGIMLSTMALGEIDKGQGYQHIGSFNIDFNGGRIGPAIKATSFPNIFPSLPLDPSAEKSIASMESVKWPLCVFTLGLRTEADPLFGSSATSGTRFTGRSMLRANPIAVNQDLFNLDPGLVRASGLQVGIRRVNSLSSPIIECDAKGLGYYGAEYGLASGVSYVVGNSVPLDPIQSLGALQQSIAVGNQFGKPTGETTANLLPIVSHPIANSFAPSILAPDEVRGQIAGRNIADHSYLANLALWDTYFHSSITPKTTSAQKDSTTAYSEQKSRLKSFLSPDSNAFQALPNERMRPWTSDPDATLAEIFSANKPASDAADRIAAHLTVDGMFNVNSTSVTAWKAVLSGLRDAGIPVRDSLNPAKNAVPTKTKVSSDTPVSGLLAPGGGEIPATGLGLPGSSLQWRGFRSLNETQIDELAKAIVKQVRLRGPFLSIADFVNRRPGSDKDLALSGPLQSALDDPSVSINADFRQGGRALGVAEASAQGFLFPEAEAGAKAAGSAGYVKQGDLLTALGPLINVRGDTFVIRAYGDSRDTTGTKIVARAWCEAVVQRVPDFIDPADMAHVALSSLTSMTNKNFGRRFRVISFRFLAPQEIF